jgi:bacterioferritin
VPGSFEFKAEQRSLQPPAESTDVVSVIKGVIEAEQGAIDHYTSVIKACEGVDYVTADMVTTILGDEEGHLREFEGFLKEYEKR